MRGDGNGLGLRHGRRRDKRQEHEHKAQHDAMEKHSRKPRQHKVLTQNNTR
jgi:hypothetical protein